MEQKIAPDVEHRLTRAIEKAASLMAVNMDRNPNELIAGQLKQANVDKKFARVAAQAFNKRATVIHLSKTADEHKADDFPLADPDTVYELCGGVVERPLAKAASVSFEEKSFVFDYTKADTAMAKAASVQNSAQIPYERRVDIHVFHRHLDSILDKCANVFRELNYDYDKLRSNLIDRADKLAEHFNKSACQSFEFTTAAKLFGKDLKTALGSRIPDMPLEKSANVVDPGTPATKGMTNLIADMHKLAAMKQELIEFGKYANELAQAVADWGEYYTRKGGAAMPKTAGWAEDNPLLAQTGKNMLTLTTEVPAVALETGVSALRNNLDTLQSTAVPLLGNAVTAYQAGRDLDVSPGRVLEADFINKDRLRDRMMAISDLSADKGLAAYPFKDVFRSAMKAMDTNLALERPDRRETLRAYVSQLLPQSNRAGMADLAALGTLMDSRKETQSAAETSFRNNVGTLDKVKPAESVSLEIPKDFLSAKTLDTTAFEQIGKEIDKNRDTAKKDSGDKDKKDKETRGELNKAVMSALKNDTRVINLKRRYPNLTFIPTGTGDIGIYDAHNHNRRVGTFTAEDIAQIERRVMRASQAFGEPTEVVDVIAGMNGKSRNRSNSNGGNRGNRRNP